MKVLKVKNIDGEDFEGMKCKVMEKVAFDSGKGALSVFDNQERYTSSSEASTWQLIAPIFTT